MKKFILVTLLTFLPLFAGGIDTSKKAVTVAAVSTLSKANEIAKSLPEYDMYIYKTTSTKIPKYITYAVNIEKSELSLALTDIKKSFRDSYLSSNKRIKALASNNFENNVFISTIKLEENNFVVHHEENVIALKENVEEINDVAQNDIIVEEKTTISMDKVENEIQTTDNFTIDVTKKALLVGYAKNISEAKKLASQYKDNDIYIYNTMKDGSLYSVVYIVNIEKSNFTFLLNVISQTNDTVSELTSARIKYFARNISQDSVYIASSNNVVTSPEESYVLNDMENENIVVSAIEEDQYNIYSDDIVEINAVETNSIVSNENQQISIDANKKSILLGYVRNINKAKLLASQYKNNDIYIYKTLKDGSFVCAVYIVNIEQTNINSVLTSVSSYMPKAEIVSAARVKYFAKDTFSDNLLVAANSKSYDIKPVTIASTSTNTNIVITSKNIDIDISKKAILLGYADNINEAKELAEGYESSDVYIYNTVRDDKFYCAVYIVNVDENKIDDLLSTVLYKNHFAKEISKSKLKYFATNDSNDNLFVRASKEFNNDVFSLANNEINIPTVSEDGIVAVVTDTEFNNINEPTDNKIALVDEFMEPTATNSRDDEVVSFAKTENIKESIGRKVSNFVFVAVNNISNSISYNLNSFSETFNQVYTSFNTKMVVEPSINRAIDAYSVMEENVVNKVSSFVVVATDNISNSIYHDLNSFKTIFNKVYTSFNTRILIEPSSDKIIDTYAMSNEVQNNKNDNLLYLLDSKSIKFDTIISKEESVTLNTIDTNKKAITIANVSILSKAKRIAKTLSQYDMYIYKTTSTEVSSFVIYAVNINKNKLNDSISTIKKDFLGAYASSDKRIKTLATNNFKDNIFIATSIKVEKEQIVTEDKVKSDELVISKVEEVVDDNLLYLLDRKATTLSNINTIKTSDAFHTIDIDKKAITIANTSTIKKAQNIAKDLSEYDVYIYQTTNNNFVIYAVNIPKKELSLAITSIQGSFIDAYASSDKRIETLVFNNFNENIFVKSKTILPQLSSLNF